MALQWTANLPGLREEGDYLLECHNVRTNMGKSTATENCY